MKFLLPLLVLFIMLTTSATAQTTSTAPASAPTTTLSDDHLTQLQRNLESIKTVQADFVQEKKLSVFKRTLVIRGKFALERPTNLVWIVKEPVKYAININGNQIKQWDEDTNRVQVINIGNDPAFKAVFEQFQGWFMGNFKTLAQSYDLAVVKNDPLILSFTPKPDAPMAKMIKKIELTFGQDHLYIDTITIHEGAGDTTTIRFLNTKLNEPVNKTLWEMPPHEIK